MRKILKKGDSSQLYDLTIKRTVLLEDEGSVGRGTKKGDWLVILAQKL